MRTVTVGTAILCIGTLAALPFRRAAPRSAGPDRIAAVSSTASQRRITPLREVPLDEFAQRPHWIATPQRPAPEPIAPQPIRTILPQLPESYTDVAVPLATPQAIADRYSATQPLRGSRAKSQGHPTGLTASAAGPQAGWRRGLPLGRWSAGRLPVGPPAADSVAEVPSRQPSMEDVDGEAPAADDQRPAREPPSATPWLSPEQVALAAEPQRTATADDRTPARPAGHSIPAPAAASETGATADPVVPQESSGERPTRLYIREPAA